MHTPDDPTKQTYATLQAAVKDAERINAIASKVITRLEEEARQAGLLRRKRG